MVKPFPASGGAPRLSALPKPIQEPLAGSSPKWPVYGRRRLESMNDLNDRTMIRSPQIYTCVYIYVYYVYTSRYIYIYIIIYTLTRMLEYLHGRSPSPLFLMHIYIYIYTHHPTKGNSLQGDVLNRETGKCRELEAIAPPANGSRLTRNYNS